MIGQSESWNTNDREFEQYGCDPVLWHQPLGELLRAHERFRRAQLSRDVLL
jgi:hypothetical protein